MNYSHKPNWSSGGGRNRRRTMPLLGLLLILAAVAAWPRAGYATQDWAPPGDDGEKEWTACKATPNPECLYDGLIVIARLETNELKRESSIDWLARASAEKGELKKALTLAETFEEENRRFYVFSDIATNLAKAGHPEEALRVR